MFIASQKKLFKNIFSIKNFKQMPPYHKKSIFSGINCSLPLLSLKPLRFFGYYYTHFGRDQRSHFNNGTFSKMFSAMEVLSLWLPYVKRHFQWHQWIYFSLGLKLFRFCCFRECRFGGDHRSQFNNSIFSKVFSAMEVLGMWLPYVPYVKRYF